MATDPPQDPSGWPRAALVCETDQPVDRGGIVFRVSLTNDGDDTIRLSNPYESITYQVTDSEGWPISIKAPSRAAKINRPSGSRPSKAHYLALIDLRVDGKRVSADEAEAAEAFDVPGNSGLALEMRVPTVLAEYGSSAVQSPAAGVYHVSVLLPLSWMDGDERRTALLRSPESVTVAMRDNI